MFKKLLVVSLVALFAFTGANMSLAKSYKDDPRGTHDNGNGWGGPPEQNDDGGCGGQPCNPEEGQTVEFSTGAFAADYDKDYSSTGHWGNHNDKAKGEVTSRPGFEMSGYANADGGSLEIVGWKWIFPIIDYVPNPADVEFDNFAKGKGKAWSYARDYGQTSLAGAGAKTAGYVHLSGEAFGVGGCEESLTATAYFGGDVHQYNQAGETGYSNGQFVEGGNESWAGGMAHTREFSDSGQSYNILGFEFGGAELDKRLYNEGGVITKGSTYVTIDPSGKYRSFEATTQNFGKVDFGCGLTLMPGSYVNGFGGVAGFINNGQASAGGMANFSYQGSTYGEGNANIDASITPSTVRVSGSAHAVGN